jgi:hypothetical protein
MNPIQRLRDVKLVVIGGNGIYRIFKPAHENGAGDEINFMGWSSESPEVNTTIKLSDRRGLLYFENNLWVFRVWDHIPGPGPDDFAYGYQDLNRAVDAALTFYEGEATQIGDWLVPLHRHPYLNVDAVRAVINDAKPIAEAVFNDLNKERSTQIAADDRRGHPGQMQAVTPQALMRQQFIQCNPLNPAQATLFLRRDAEEAYLLTPAVSGE